MPTIKLNKSTVMELLGRKINDNELSERISMLGVGFEGVDENEIAVEVFPNRPDLLSEQGFARALRTFLGIRPGFAKFDVKKSNVKVIVDKSVANVRPYTACAVVKNLKFTDERIKEVIQIQEKLHVTYGRNRKKTAIGIYPLEHVKSPIFYKALNPAEIKFKPLDMNKELSGSQILAIHPTGREYAHLLEGYSKYPVFIDSKLQFMSMPPIINSNNVGKITSSTKEVFIECSGFDFDYLHTCLNILVTALADMGGQIYTVEVLYPGKKHTTPNLEGREMKIDIEYVNKILGLELKEPEMKKLLEKMGHDYKSKKVTVPAYRADILHPADIVEDIAIAYGYENFHGKISDVVSVAAERPMSLFKNKIREILIGTGLIEVKNYHITSRDNQTKLMNHSSELVEVESNNTEYSVLRSWIIPSLLENFRYNKPYDYPQNIFEIGSTFKINDSYDTMVEENERLCVALCGNDSNYTKIKQILDALMESLDLKYDIQDSEHDSFIKGRVGRVAVNEEKLAYIGEIHPQVLLNWSLDMPVAVLELNITGLFRVMHMPADIEMEHHAHKDRHEDKEKPRKHSSKKNKHAKKSPSKKPSKKKHSKKR